MRPPHRAFALPVLLLLGSCSVGPEYRAPEPELPDAWEAAVVEELGSGAGPLETWWEGFEDPLLDSLIERARESNLGVQAAAARIREARALQGAASGQHLPDVALDASATRTKLSDNGAQPPPPGGFEDFDLFEVGAGFQWEIDLFGRIRASVEAATAALEASVEDHRDVLVVLYAQVASTYVDIRSLQTRIAYAEANVEAQQESLQLTKDRFKAGLVSALDVAQAESNLATTESGIPSLRSALESSLNRLAVLLGEQPGALHAELAEAQPVPAPAEGIALGLPADLLRRRPDVRAAERRLAAQTAQIGVATADLYPSLSLSGFLALQSTSGGDLLSGDSVTWGLVPGLRWNLFSGGKLRNLVRAEEARAEQARLAWEQTVLSALEEVETSLVAYARERERRDALLRAVDASTRTVELVRTQYLSGLTNFQVYLDAQRSLFQQQDQLAVSEGRVVTDLIALNRALGGGWELGSSSVAGAPESAPVASNEAAVADGAAGGSR